MRTFLVVIFFLTSHLFGRPGTAQESNTSHQPVGESQRLLHNHPGLAVDLGVGLWAQPFPMDYDGDGDHDLLVATADKPYNGIYFFENSEGDVQFPLFKPGVRLDDAKHNIRISYSGNSWELTQPGQRFPDFAKTFFERPVAIPYEPTFHLGRAKQWAFVDFDGDGVRDLIIGATDWREYGWDDAFNEKGEWIQGPIHGYVYVMRNAGTDEEPSYEETLQLQAGGKVLDVYGCPSPSFSDFDGDGDLDLVCGSFLDRLTYFENTGSRTEPEYAEGRFLTSDGQVIEMDLEMLQVVSFDWDKDGDTDLIVGEEDGRVSLIENEGKTEDGTPSFLPPRFFKQEASAVKFGALVTPCSTDWDGDGDEDLIAGNTAGYLGFIENLDGGDPPRWAEPVYLEAEGNVIRVQAGPNGSIQGPCEAKWGYTAPSVGDWNGDGLPDIVINSIWGKVEWFENIGTKNEPKLAATQPIEVEWEGPTPKPDWFWWNPEGKELVTQWRTTPFVTDLNGDGLTDLVMLDVEGYLVFHKRVREGEGLNLLPGQRIFKDENGELLRPNPRPAGKSGRRKFVMTDWDGDGKLDILINSRNTDFLHNVAEKEGDFVFKNLGELDARRLAGHSTSPTVVDWDKNGVPDLLTGAEDGLFYYLKSSRGARDPALEPPRVDTSPGPGYATRDFQGIPSLARAPGGRLWAIWYGGGEGEGPHNYSMVVTSGDDGETWSDLKLVIDPPGPVRSYDPNIWVDPEGRLWVFWAQSYKWWDGRSGTWAIVTENPDEENPDWSAPRRLTDGIMMCKPTVLSSGEWLFPIGVWNREVKGPTSPAEKWFAHDLGDQKRSRVFISKDKGESFDLLGQADVPDRSFDEHMIVERKDGSFWMLVRTHYGIGQSFSTDRGETWGKGEPSGLHHTSARFFIRRLNSGNLLLVKHSTPGEKKERSHLTAHLSEDDGKTWTEGLLLDERKGVSYPDGVQAPDGTIYIIYDYSRTGEKKILMATFTEEDILARETISDSARLRTLVNQATGTKSK